VVDIALIRTNSIIYDIRVIKILKSLSKRYNLLVLGWDRKGIYNYDYLKRQMNWESDVAGAEIKIMRIRAPFNSESLASYIPMIVYFPLFWIWVFLNLIKFKPKVLHACDLDTAVPCYFYKLLFKKKLVFDVFDRYAMTLIPAKFKTLYAAVNLFEEYFSKRANVLITISKMVLSTFRKKPEKCLIIMNCPEDHYVRKEKLDEHKPLRIVYTGAIWKKSRGLENITSAIEDLPNVELIIAGWYRESDKEFLNDILKMPNVKFMGLLQPNDALALEASSDVIIALYQPEFIWYNITLPNKLFEAMMCGVPIITNVAREVVGEADYGIIVEFDDVKNIKEAILALRDNTALRHRLGANGRKAFLEKYSWLKMEEELFNLYESLLHK
jgi:glycosyltransferase involved in cell wall biosynthesis